MSALEFLDKVGLLPSNSRKRDNKNPENTGGKQPISTETALHRNCTPQIMHVLIAMTQDH